jgi:tripartite-type tricarboxylate transporter receptor subunit TctC
MKITLSRILRTTLTGGFAAIFAGGFAFADTYPSKPVTLVHAYPGFAMDAVIRAAAEKLQDKWGQPVVVETKPGANEVIAANTVAQADPDGYTILVGTESTFLNNPYLYNQLPYDPATDLEPVSQLFVVNFGLLVRGDFPADTAQEFIDHVKANPSKNTFGSFGVGHIMHLGMEKFNQTAGLEMKHVPYSNGGQMLQDMLGGQLDATVASSLLATRFGKGGKLRMLAMNGDERQSVLPDVPTYKEIGFDDLDIFAIVGLAVPGQTPTDIKETIYEAFNDVLSDAEFLEKVVAPNGYELIASSPAEFAASIKDQGPATKTLIDDLGVSLSQ